MHAKADDDRETPVERPWWVKVSLWGVPGRASAWGFVWLSIAAAMGCVAWGFVDPPYFSGVLFLAAAGLYFASIRWVDAHDGW